MGYYQWFIKGCACIAQPLNGLLSGEGDSRKSERVSLPEDALRAFNTLKQACMSAPVLAIADYTKEFLLETGASKEGLGAVLSQKQADGNTTQLPMVVQPLWLMKETTMGHYRTFQGVLAIPTLLCEN